MTWLDRQLRLLPPHRAAAPLCSIVRNRFESSPCFRNSPACTGCEGAGAAGPQHLPHRLRRQRQVALDQAHDCALGAGGQGGAARGGWQLSFNENAGLLRAPWTWLMCCQAAMAWLALLELSTLIRPEPVLSTIVRLPGGAGCHDRLCGGADRRPHAALLPAAGAGLQGGSIKGQAGLMLALLLRPKAALLGCECTAWRPVHLSSLCAVSVEGFGSTCLDPFSLQVGTW